jgi:hypothetical protein
MGFIKDTLKGTYKFAREELSPDIKRIPGSKKAVKRVRKVRKTGIKSLVKSKITVKQGKSISTEKALSGIVKKLPKSKFKKAKYKKKKASQIKKEVFNTGLNIQGIY